MRTVVADTFALLTYWTAANALNEWLVAGMDGAEIARARAYGVPVLLVCGRPYGLWRDWVLARGRSLAGRPLIWDTVALLSFWVPIYTATLWASGAREGELWRGALGAAAIMVLSGRPYGLWLDWVRRRLGPRSGAPGAEAP